MKKTLTFLAVMMMLGAVCMAQGSIIRSAKQSNLPAAFSKQVVAVKGQNAVKGFATKAVAFSQPVWNSDTMSYCGDDAFATGVGISSDTSTMYWGIKIDADALVGRNTITIPITTSKDELRFRIPTLCLRESLTNVLHFAFPFFNH